MFRRSLVSRFAAGAVVVALSSVVMWSAGCQSVQIDVKSGIVKIVGRDSFTITAKGYEDALDKALDHLMELEKSHADSDAIKSWREICDALISAKRSAKTSKD